MLFVNTYIRFLRGSSPEYALTEGDTAYPLTGSTPASFQRTGEALPLNDLQLLPPCSPGKIVGVGLNYNDIILEDGQCLPNEPKLFLKSPQAILFNGSAIQRPPEVEFLSCEVELAVVIGKTARNISSEEALDVVWGYLVANDVTASDIQKKDVLWGRAKNYDTFLPISQQIVAGIDPNDLHLTCLRNSETIIDSYSSRMIYSVAQLISYISHVMTLCPGDMILTGTPTGYGVPVQPGDTIEVRIDGIGHSKNLICS